MPYFTITNKDEGPAEILIYGMIGKDWTGEGTGAKDFADELKLIPSNKEILLRVNSPGGNVWDGLAIYNQLAARRAHVVSQVDGVAASAASWIALAGRELRMPKNSLMMIHRTSGMAIGNAEAMKKMSEELERHDGVIAQLYSDKCKKPKDEMLKAMADETWFTGQEAKDFGLADTVTDEVVLSACLTPQAYNIFRRVPDQLKQPNNSAARKGAGAQTKDIMNRDEMIALLKARGITVDNAITDEELKTKVADALKLSTPAPAVQPATNTGDLSALTAVVNNLAAAVAKLEKPVAPAPAPENEQAKPATGAAPFAPVVTTVTADVSNIWKEIERTNGMERAVTLKANRDKVQGYVITNTNTIATQLKRQVILSDMVTAFARKLAPLRAFTTMFTNVPLQGLGTVEVQYYALDSTASTSFNGTYSTGNTTASYKEITINQRYYQGLSFTSDEFRRQPYFNAAQGMKLKAAKLGCDVFDAIWAGVTTSAFGAAAVTESASAFDVSHVGTLKVACDKAYWPSVGRSLILDSDHDNNLMNDTRLGGANYLSNSAIAEGTVPMVKGFAYYPVGNLPTNSANIAGAAIFPSALLVAFAPIEPAPDVRSQLTAYEIIVEPETGIALEYRRWGAASVDTSYEVVECNYGLVAGEAAACKIITSA